MGQPFISVIISHPDWKRSQQELRGDIRSLAKKQEWQITISSSLPKGTPLNVELQNEGTILPKEMKLLLKDVKVNKQTDLKAGNYTLPAPGPGTTTKILIIAEQP
jgi:hypothetical protein